jgi:hypothetical protein
MKKQLFLGMVTLLVAIPGFSQIKAAADDNWQISGKNPEWLFTPHTRYQLDAYQYQPKLFRGVLIPAPQPGSAPAWLKPEAWPLIRPQTKSSVNQKKQVIRPDSTIRYY